MDPIVLVIERRMLERRAEAASERLARQARQTPHTFRRPRWTLRRSACSDGQLQAAEMPSTSSGPRPATLAEG